MKKPGSLAGLAASEGHMRPVGFDDLSEDVIDKITELQIKVMDLENEAKLWRVGTFAALILFADWAWRRLF